MKKIIAILLLFSMLASMPALLATGCANKSATQGQIIKDVSAQEALGLIKDNRDNPDFIIVDVRTPQEYADGHIENAVNIDFNSGVFDSEIAKLDRDKAYLIYCRSGNRSQAALKVMKGLEFKEIYHMYQGIIGWTDAGYATVK